jgi:O-antigen/teichoic acid export membrane protein
LVPQPITLGFRLSQLIWYAGLYAGSAALLRLVGFVLFVWLAHSLSVEDYATFGLYYALQTGLATIALAGIVEVVVGLLKEHQNAHERRQLFAAANSVFVPTAAGAILVAVSIFSFVAGSARNAVAAELCVVLSGALLAFASLQSQIVRLQERHRASLYFSFLPQCAGLVAGFGAFFHERTVESFFVGNCGGVLIALLALRIVRVGSYGFGRTSQTRVIYAHVAPFIAIAFLGWLSGYGNNYFVKMFFAPTQVARYTFALTLSSVVQLMAAALNQVWSPRFFRLIHELPFNEAEGKNLAAFRLQAIALGVVGGGVIALCAPILGMLGGNLQAYRSMQFELLLLFASYVLLCPWWHCYNHFLAQGKGDALMRIVLVTSVAGIATWVALMWKLGPLGIYVGFLAQMVFRSLAIVFAAKRLWPVRIAWDGVAAGLLSTLVGFAIAEARDGLPAGP